MPTLNKVDSPERGVVLLDRHSRILSANARASQLFGIPMSDLIGSELPDAIVHRVMEPCEVVEEVLEGTLIPQRVLHRYSTPLFSQDSEPSVRIEIYSDITARRGLEKEILDRNEELAELNSQLEEAQEQLVQSERLRALGEMAAGVAHDINNVLGIILGNAQLARRKLAKDDPAATSVEAIEFAARDGAQTVRRLREIGKPMDKSGYVRVDLGEIVNDVVKAAIPAWRESGSCEGLEISVETSLTDGCSVLGNPVELREALANVLLNAVQSIDIGGRIDISTSKTNRFAEMTIHDTGAGMSEETRKRLFDPFYTTRGTEGTGLGMSMVDAIAIRHSGKVIVESQEGKGTSITLRFPIDSQSGQEE